MSYDVYYDMRAGRYDLGFMSYDVVNDISHVYNDIVTPWNDIVIDIGTGRHDMQSMSYDVYYDMAMSITTSSGRGATSITTWGAIPRGLGKPKNCPKLNKFS